MRNWSREERLALIGIIVAIIIGGVTAVITLILSSDFRNLIGLSPAINTSNIKIPPYTGSNKPNLSNLSVANSNLSRGVSTPTPIPSHTPSPEKTVEPTPEKDPPPKRSKGVLRSDVPLVNGEILPRYQTTVFGESYPDSIYLPKSLATFRTAKKYKELILKLGVQDNQQARGQKRISIRSEDDILYEIDVVPNRPPILVKLNISYYDLISFVVKPSCCQPRDHIRFINVTFVPK